MVAPAITSRPMPSPGYGVPMLLSVRDLRVSYRTDQGEAHAVDGVSFDVRQAEMVGLVGESGCGKTTAARALTGVMAGNARITSGSIEFTGHDILKYSPEEMRALRWREIAFIPQSAMNSLDPVYRAEQQMREVLARGGIRGRAAADRMIALLDMVGLGTDVLRLFPASTQRRHASTRGDRHGFGAGSVAGGRR
jgi:peptide/nickel transport system ATP-binding protein